MNFLALQLRVAQLDQRSLRQIEVQLGGIDPRRVLDTGDPSLIVKLTSIIEKDYTPCMSIASGASRLLQPPEQRSPTKRSNVYVYQPARRTPGNTGSGAVSSVFRRPLASLPKRQLTAASRGSPDKEQDSSEAALLETLKKRIAAAKFRENEPGDEVQWVAPPGVRVVDVYTDGSARAGRAGYGIHWPEKGLGMQDVKARLPGSRQLPDRAELMAIIEALRMYEDKDSAQLRIYTDCKYCIWSNHTGRHRYRAQGWRKKKFPLGAQIPNRDLIERLEYELQQFKHRPALEYVKGHSGVPGNERADRLAREATRLPDIPREQWVDQDAPPTFNEEVVLVSSKHSRPAQEAAGDDFAILDVVRPNKRAKTGPSL